MENCLKRIYWNFLRMFKYTDIVMRNSNWTGNCSVEDDLLCLKGHFPTQPILPAIAQVNMLIDFVSVVMESPCALESASVLKFILPILPKDTVKLELDIKACEVKFTMRVDNKLCSRGKITFRSLVS